MKPDFVIKYDNHTDYKQTYAPVIKKKLIQLGNDLSDTIVSLYSK